MYALVVMHRGVTGGAVCQTVFPAGRSVQTTHVCERYPLDYSVKGGLTVKELSESSPGGRSPVERLSMIRNLIPM